MSGTDSKDKKLDELLEIVRKSPALNGGFTKLSDSVDDIKESNAKVLFELQLVKQNQDEFSENLKKLNKAIYEPDDGLYKRIAQTSNVSFLQSKEIEQIKEKQEEIETKNQEIQQKINKIETTETTLKSVAGDNLEELRSTISTRKNFVRGLWIIGSAVILGLGKILWDVILTFS